MKTEKSINSVAKDLLSKHNGNFAKAVSALKKLFLNDLDLVEQYKEEIFERAASAIVQSVFSVQRSFLFKTVPILPKGISGESQQKSLPERVKASIKVETEALLNMALNACKKLLRNATKEDLAEEINMFLSHARGNDSRAVFLTSIYSELHEEEKVCDYFTEKDLAGIMKQTQKIIDKKWNGKFVKVEQTAEEVEA